MTNRYALTDYRLVISMPSTITTAEQSTLNLPQKIIFPIIIGGPGENGYEGSFLDSIEVKRKNSVWDTKADATGSWVHNKNVDRSGTLALNISQISDAILKLAVICNAYEMCREAIGGLNLSIQNAGNDEICQCIDCYITKVPDHKFAESAATFDFEFTCGCIRYYPNGIKD